MKVDPIILDRCVFAVERETISKNDEQVKNKRGFRPVTPWRKRDRSNIGINRSDIVHIEPAAAARAALSTNASKSILRTPNQSYDTLVIDHNMNTALNENRSIVTNASMKRVTWDANVKDTKKLTLFGKMNKAVIKAAIGLDTNVQTVREKMQCGNMAVAKDFYCPSDSNNVLVRSCGRCFDEVDECSLGTNDLLEDESFYSHYQRETAAEESREEESMLRGDDQLMESRETPVEETEERYAAQLTEDRNNLVPAAMTAAVRRKKKKERSTLVFTNSASHYYTGSAPVTSPTSSIKAVTKVKGRKCAVKASPARLLQTDQSYISALTDPTTMAAMPTKKASKQDKRHQETRRYTTRQPEQSKKKGLKGALSKPIKLIAVGWKLNTRKMLRSKASM